MARSTDELPEDVKRLRHRLDEFRRGSRRGMAFPGWVWAAAGRLAKRHGVHRTGRALGLEYNKLKHASGATEIGIAGASERTLRGAGMRFVELPRVLPVADTMGGGEAVVELVAADGARLTVRLRDSSPTLLTLIGALRGRS